MNLSFETPDIADNIGGCHEFSLIPSDDVTSLGIIPSTNMVKSISLKPGKTMFKGYASFRSLSFSQNLQENDSGKYFSTQISGFYPKLSPKIISIFQRLQSLDLIVKVTDNNNQVRVVGTPINPLRFSFSQSTGNNPSQRNGISFSFSGNLMFESPFFSADT